MHHVTKRMHFYAANLFIHSATQKFMVMYHWKFCSSFCNLLLVGVWSLSNVNTVLNICRRSLSSLVVYWRSSYQRGGKRLQFSVQQIGVVQDVSSGWRWQSTYTWRGECHNKVVHAVSCQWPLRRERLILKLNLKSIGFSESEFVELTHDCVQMWTMFLTLLCVWILLVEQ